MAGLPITSQAMYGCPLQFLGIPALPSSCLPHARVMQSLPSLLIIASVFVICCRVHAAPAFLAALLEPKASAILPKVMYSSNTLVVFSQDLLMLTKCKTDFTLFHVDYIEHVLLGQ